MYALGQYSVILYFEIVDRVYSGLLYCLLFLVIVWFCLNMKRSGLCLRLGVDLGLVLGVG